jgi:hypothetical protein
MTYGKSEHLLEHGLTQHQLAAAQKPPHFELEKALDWIIQPMDQFMGARLKLNNHAVLWFSFNRFNRYDTTPVKKRIRPQITI